MAKAFNTVNHYILCKKLKILGTTRNMLKLVKNYLRIDTGGLGVIHGTCMQMFILKDRHGGFGRDL